MMLGARAPTRFPDARRRARPVAEGSCARRSPRASSVSCSAPSSAGARDSALRQTPPSPRQASESADPGTPLEDTALLQLFDRLPLADESTRVAAVDDVIDPASVRLLATRVDGPAAYLARTADDENVCLVLLMPDRPPRSECTVDGRLPADGLSILYGAEGYGLAAAQLDPTGSVSLGLVVSF